MEDRAPQASHTRKDNLSLLSTFVSGLLQTGQITKRLV